MCIATVALPAILPGAAILRGWNAHDALNVAMCATVASAGILVMLLTQVSARFVVEQEHFDAERRRWQVEAHTDPLCGVANRRGAEEALAGLVPTDFDDGVWVVMVFDVNDFKEVNDRHGHPVGDRVLVKVAQSLLEAAPVGSVVARWGGDEFVVASYGRDRPDAFPHRFAMSVSALRVASREGDLVVSVSVGLAEGRVGESFEHVLARADLDLIQAKADYHRNIADGEALVEALVERPIETRRDQRAEPRVDVSSSGAAGRAARATSA